MKAKPKIGATGEMSFVVESRHAIDIADDPESAVLSTPWLIWFLEHAAREAISSLLEPGETSVGTHVDVRHLAPTPVDDTVSCVARVIHSEGPVISFQIEARDSREMIARGLHKRAVIRADRFRRRVQKKRQGDKPG